MSSLERPDTGDLPLGSTRTVLSIVRVALIHPGMALFICVCFDSYSIPIGITSEVSGRRHASTQLAFSSAAPADACGKKANVFAGSFDLCAPCTVQKVGVLCCIVRTFYGTIYFSSSTDYDMGVTMPNARSLCALAL